MKTDKREHDNRDKRFSKESPTPAEYPQKPYYVTMTDTFFTGAPNKNGMKNKFVVGCDNLEDAREIRDSAKGRSEMKYVSLATNAPNYDNAYVDYRDYTELGGAWKQ